MNGGGSMWEPDQFTRPLGVPAERSGTNATPSALEGGERAAITPPPSLPADADEQLRSMVYALRLQQPEEFSVYARMAQIEKELADVKAIVDLQTETLLRSYSAIDALRLTVASLVGEKAAA